MQSSHVPLLPAWLEAQLRSHIPPLPVRLPLGRSVRLLLPRSVVNLFLHGGRFPARAEQACLPPPADAALRNSRGGWQHIGTCPRVRCRAATSPPGMWPGRLLRLRHTPAPCEGAAGGVPQPHNSSCTSQHQPGEGVGGFGSRHIAAALGTGAELVSNWFAQRGTRLPAGPHGSGLALLHGCLWHDSRRAAQAGRQGLLCPAHTPSWQQEAERRRVNARGCKPERPGPCPAPRRRASGASDSEHKELLRGGAGQKRGFGSAPTAAL